MKKKYFIVSTLDNAKDISRMVSCINLPSSEAGDDNYLTIVEKEEGYAVEFDEDQLITVHPTRNVEDFLAPLTQLSVDARLYAVTNLYFRSVPFIYLLGDGGDGYDVFDVI